MDIAASKVNGSAADTSILDLSRHVERSGEFPARLNLQKRPGLYMNRTALISQNFYSCSGCYM